MSEIIEEHKDSLVSKLNLRDIVLLLTLPFTGLGYLLGKIIENGYKYDLELYKNFMIIITRLTFIGFFAIIILYLSISLVHLTEISYDKERKKYDLEKRKEPKGLYWAIFFFWVIVAVSFSLNLYFLIKDI